ncbi:MAG TPA: hypothetical protein VJ508_08125 [Saprospiraceae bacterium]|nr:hypothetical protein [Saprospiraceae bacterium]
MNQKLIEKYWNAETSLQEESELLQDMVQSQDPDSAYFKMIAEARKQKSQLRIEDIRKNNQRTLVPQHRMMVLPVYRWVASAAAVLLFALAGFGLWNYTHEAAKPSPMADSFDDPYQAYQEIKEALAYVSVKMNKSQNEALLNIKKAGEYADMFK